MHQAVPAVSDDYFARVNTRVTRIAFRRLQWACEQRERLEASRVPQGKILVELMMAHLEPHPDENGTAAAARRKGPRSEKKRSAKTSTTTA